MNRRSFFKVAAGFLASLVAGKAFARDRHTLGASSDGEPLTIDWLENVLPVKS